MRRPFLTARWESLLLLNYACPPELLRPLVPAGTVLDTWADETLVSLVGFRFRDTRVWGVPIPFHRTFEEINLRFYVRRTAPDRTTRRIVVFIRELVPRWAIAAVARWVYNEPYFALPTAHRIALSLETGGTVEYSWTHDGAPFVMAGEVHGPAAALAPGSEAEFITEHYWGCTRQRDGSTLEYQVEHPPWIVWNASLVRFEGPASQLYGSSFGAVLRTPPRSAFVAVGSEVAVFPGQRLTPAVA
jgi:uncharacterized protein YqjF (DUF2071 family)